MNHLAMREVKPLTCMDRLFYPGCKKFFFYCIQDTSKYTNVQIQNLTLLTKDGTIEIMNNSSLVGLFMNPKAPSTLSLVTGGCALTRLSVRHD